MALYVVGDPKQRIYGFNGASEQVFEDVEDWLQGLSVQAFSMPMNYRSTINIVNSANNLISHNFDEAWEWDRIEPHPGAKQGEPVSFISVPTPEAQAYKIISIIEECDLPYQDVFVFARTNAQVGIISDIFKEEGIPHKVVSEDYTFWDKRHIKIAIAYLELSENGGDIESLRMAMNTPSTGFTDRKGHYQPTRFLSIEKFLNVYGNYHQAVVSMMGMRKGMRAAVEDLSRMVSQISDANMHGKASIIIDAVSKMLRNGSGLKDVVSDDLERLEKAMTKARSAKDFLSHVEKLKRVSLKKNNSRNVIEMGTLHSSKGRERPYVFLVGCCEGVSDDGEPFTSSIPSRYTFVAPESEGNLYPGRMSDMEEERRLFFVGVTRAMTRLWCLWFKKWGDDIYQESRFLREMRVKEVY